ncbi:initiator tRNA phosphoribosyl transferase [Crassisporium funariophilum]|nr:initiator tRNA phosphoribosyl transferase [Crassisporium funariophilum]
MHTNVENALPVQENINALSYLRKESLDIYNRLHSVEEDIAFVEQVQQAYPDIPILPNLRCGAWYTNTETASDVPVYFKSTDGHFSNWSFNLRRANLHLLPLIIERKGVILVDSTRSGKRIPDALSKTVPIWCAVINRALRLLHPEHVKLNSSADWNCALYTPPGVVSTQEHHQIEKRLDEWAQNLANSSFSLPILPCPLRPMWLTPATSTFPAIDRRQPDAASFLPVICVSASKQIEKGVERRSGGFAYVQGSGDDHELWGMGLTPATFWMNRSELLAANRAELQGLVSQLVAADPSSSPLNKRISLPSSVEKVGGRLLLGTLGDVPEGRSDDGLDDIAYLLLTPSIEDAPLSAPQKSYVPTIAGKKGQAHFLQVILPAAMVFIRRNLAAGKRVCVACESGKDLSVGVVLAALQLFFADTGSIITPTPSATISESNVKADKKSLRIRLEWIIASRPEANPSRTTLKRVNEFLLSFPGSRMMPSEP